MTIKEIWKRKELRFLLVGVLNTIVGYGAYAILLSLNINYLIANTISTIIGIAHSYLWNRFFTFKSKEKASKELVKFISVYFISYCLGTITLFMMKNIFGINPYIAGLINLVITTLISWFGHKNFSFSNKEIDLKWLNSEKPLKIEWIVLAIISVIIFITFLYGDILITANASIIFDKLLFTGDLKNFYLATYRNLPGMFQDTYITYDFPIYIFFGLWNMPLYLMSLITKVRWETSLINIIYVKSFLLLLSFLAIVVMNKILDFYNLKKDDKKMYNFLFYSSAIFIMVIGMFGGYDILSIIFTLLGIYYYLKDDHKKFVFFFAIAISLKLFALFIFIPLLLLKEKKLGKIILSMIGALSILLFSKIIYYNAPMYLESMTEFETNMFNKLNFTSIPGPFSNFSVFITIYILINCWCYCKKIEDKRLFNLYTMYIPLCVYGFFMIFTYAHPQWSILMLPYLIFFLVYNKKDRKKNLLIEMTFTIFLLLTLYLAYQYVFHPVLTQHMLLPQIFPIEGFVGEMGIMNRLVPYKEVIVSISLATFISLLWINKPEKILEQTKSEKWENGLIVARMLIIIPFVAIIYYYYFR